MSESCPILHGGRKVPKGPAPSFATVRESVSPGFRLRPQYISKYNDYFFLISFTILANSPTNLAPVISAYAMVICRNIQFL